MNLKTELEWIHKELDKVKDPNLLTAIKNILKYRKNVTSGRISVEQYNKELEASIRQIKEGKICNHQEVGKRIQKW